MLFRSNLTSIRESGCGPGTRMKPLWIVLLIALIAMAEFLYEYSEQTAPGATADAIAARSSTVGSSTTGSSTTGSSADRSSAVSSTGRQRPPPRAELHVH